LVLKNVVAICRAEKRDPDLLARVGGEEFAMMLPETTEAAAAQFAERLRREVAGTMPTVYGEKLGVTISIGVAGATIRTAGVEALLRCADRALYEAKRSGRDRVVVSKPSDADPDLAREAAE
jgi:diguanylate cyclase (GGDEF)-like protein